MAKKKKGKRHRNPVAPPVHSAPASYTPRVPATEPPPARPSGAEPPGVPVEADVDRPVSTPRRPRQTPAQLKQAKRRKARRRNWLIAGTLIVLLVGGIVAQRITSSRANRELNQLARAAGCDGVRETGESGEMEHLAEGETTKYDTSPPTHGKHAASTLPQGVYDEPLSEDPTETTNVYRAVHSLEHGAVIIWHDKLSDDDVDDLDRTYGDEKKVILAAYPDLKGDTRVALTAWGRLAECEKASPEFINAFIDRFREAQSAPEPRAAI